MKGHTFSQNPCKQGKKQPQLYMQGCLDSCFVFFNGFWTMYIRLSALFCASYVRLCASFLYGLGAMNIWLSAHFCMHVRLSALLLLKGLRAMYIRLGATDMVIIIITGGT